MEVKKAIKKVIALGAGAIMVSATIMGAMAADLKDYPSPFLTAEKKLDGYLVVGKMAATEDVLGSIDIANNLQAEAVIEKAVEGEAEVVTVAGDSWKVGTSSDTLEISEAFDQALTKISGSQLDALKAGEVDTTVGGTAKYEQYIRLEDGTVNFYKNSASGHGAKGVGLYLYYANKGKFMNYSMIFTDAWDATLGSTTTADVTYFEEDKLTILGQPWTVVDATRPQTSREDSLKMILIGGGVPITMQTGDPAQTIEIDGIEHEISVSSIYTTKAYVTVDGTTKDINSGEIQSVGDLLVGITSISVSAKEAVADTVKFVVGGQRLELRDNEIADDQASSHKLRVGTGGNNVPNSEVIIRGTDDNSTLTVTEIRFNLVTDRAYYLDGDEYKKLSEVIHNSYLKQALDALNIDLLYEGLTEEDTYDIAISGGDTYTLDFEDTKGNVIDLAVAYKASDATNLTFGDSSTELVLDPDALTGTDDVPIEGMFILTDYANKQDGKTEILTYSSYSYDSDTNSLSITLDAKSGEAYTVSMTDATSKLQGSLVVDGISYTVINNSDSAGSDPTIRIDRDSGTPVFDKIMAKGGHVIWLRTNGTALIPGQIVFDIAQNEQMVDGSSSLNAGGAAGVQTMAFNFTQPASTDTYVQMARAEPASGSWKQKSGESNTYRYTNEYGIASVFETPSGGSQTVTLTMPLKQIVPQVFLASGAVVTTTEAAEGAVTQEIVPINVGAAKLDTEIIDEFGDDFASKVNLIVVGGPCINSVAYRLMGSTTPLCGEASGLKIGESVIKLFESGDKVSMLVAGWEAGDTRKACEIVANHAEVENFGGKELSVKTVDGTVTKVEAGAAAEEEGGEEA